MCNQCKFNECKCNYFNKTNEIDNTTETKPSNQTNNKTVNNIDLKKFLFELKNPTDLMQSGSTSSATSTSTLISTQNSLIMSPSTSSIFSNSTSNSQIISLVNT